MVFFSNISNMKKHISNNYLVLALYVASIFYSLHYALTLYLASSFIERYTGLEKVGLVYTFASILSIYFVFSISGLLNKFSNYKIMMSTLLLEIFVLLVLSISNSALLGIPFFVIQQNLKSYFFFSIKIIKTHKLSN